MKTRTIYNAPESKCMELSARHYFAQTSTGLGEGITPVEDDDKKDDWN